MLRQKSTKIELKIEDKEELEQARQRIAATTTRTTTTTTVLNHIDGSKDLPPPILRPKPSLSGDPQGAGSDGRRR